MKRIVLIAAAAVLVLGIALAFLLPALIDADGFRPTIEKAIASATGRSVTLGALRFRLLPAPMLAASGITIGEDPRFGAEPFLKADALEVRVRLLPILAGRLSVSSLTIESPRLALRRSRESRWNLASLASGGAAPEGGAAGAASSAGGAGAAPSSPGVSFSVGRLHLARGVLTFVDEGLERGKESAIEAREIDLTITDLSTTSPVGVDLAFQIVGSGRARLTGRLGPPPAPGAPASWPIDARLRIDGFEGGPVAPYLARFTGVRVHGGALDLDVTVKGKAPESLAIEGDADLKGLEVDPLSGGGAAVRLDGSVALAGAFSPDEARLSRCDVKTGGSTISITGSLADLRGRPALDARLVTKRVALKDVAPVLRIVGPILPAGLAMKGEISLEAAVRGPLDAPDRMSIEGRATIAGLELADPSLRQPVTEIGGTITLKGDRAEIAEFTAALGRSRVSGGCTISRFERPVLDVRLAAPLLDVDDLISLLAAPARQQAAVPAIGEGPLRPDVVPASLPSPPRAETSPARSEAPAAAAPSLLRVMTVRGEIAAGEIKILNLKLSQGRARLAMEDGTARLEDLNVGLYKGSLAGAASAALVEAGPPFTLSARLQGVDFNPLASDFSADLRNLVHGTLEATLDVGGRGLTIHDLKRDLAGKGTLALRDGKLTSFGFLKILAKALEAAGGRGIGQEETPFKSLTGSFDIARGRARTEDLRLDSDDIDMKGKGSVTLDLALDLDVKARISDRVSADMVGRTSNLKYLLDDKGRLTVDCRLGGSLMEPSVGIDPEMLRRAAKAAAKEQAERKGEDLLQKLLKKKKE